MQMRMKKLSRRLAMRQAEKMQKNIQRRQASAIRDSLSCAISSTCGERRAEVATHVISD